MISLAIQKQKRRRKNEEQERLCVTCAIYNDEGGRMRVATIEHVCWESNNKSYC